MHPLRDAFRLPIVLVRHRELLWSFVRRELKARIEGSMLGRLWPVIQPAMLFAIYYLVFAQILKIGFSDDLAPHGPDQVGWRSTFYLITGILPWTLTAESLTQGSGVVLENANLIKKIAFPSELLPVYRVLVFYVYFVMGFVILLGLELIINGSLPFELVWVPAVMFVQFMLVTGLAMFLSAANIFVRDVAQGVPVLATFWMFTTPVFYDLGAITDHAHAKLAEAEHLVAQGGDPGLVVAAQDTLQFTERMVGVMEFNPMAGVLTLYRSIFSYGRVPFDTERLLSLGGAAALVLLLGYAFFLRCKGRFADEV